MGPPMNETVPATNTDGDGDADLDLDFLKVVNGIKSYFRFNIQISIPISEIRDAVNLAYEHNAHYPRAYAIEILKQRGFA